MTPSEAAQVRELGRRALIAERERCAEAIEAMMTPERGAEYGLATEEQRREIRQANSVFRVAAGCVRRLTNE